MVAIISMVAISVQHAVARPIVWYRFSEGDVGESTTSPGEKTIVNSAETGSAYDGRVWTCTANGGNGKEGYAATDAYAGTYSESFPNTSYVIDPLSSSVFPNDRSLYMNSEEKTGYGDSTIITIDDSEELQSRNLTVEMFVKFDSLERGTWRTLAFRSANKVNGTDTWAIRVLDNGKINARTSWYEWDSIGETNIFRSVDLSGGNIFDGRWHHVALVVDGDAQKMSLYCDYQLLSSKDLPFDIKYSDGDPIMIGNTLFASYGAMGGAWIDEFRISDTALDVRDFLRVSSRKQLCVDDDTVAYLTFDEINWFGKNPLSGENPRPLYNLAYGTASTNANLYVNTGTVTFSPEIVPGDGVVRDGFFGLESSNAGSLHFKTNATPMKSGTILIPDLNRRITSGSFTIEGFFRWEADSIPHQTHYFVSEHSVAGWYGIRMQGLDAGASAGKVEFRVIAGVDNGAVTNLCVFNTSESLCDGRWHHLAMVFDSDTQTISCYRDYGLVGRKAGIGPLFVLPVSGTNGKNRYENNLMIGSGYYTTSQYQMNEGYIDEIRISKRALSKSEFLRRDADSGEDARTLAWWSFEDGLNPLPRADSRVPDEMYSMSYTYSNDVKGCNGNLAVLCDGNGRILREGNSRSLDMPYGWWAKWKMDPFFEGLDCEALTLEFFAKSRKGSTYSNVLSVKGMRKGPSANSLDVNSSGEVRNVCAIQTAYTNLYYRTDMSTTSASSGNAMTGDTGDIHPLLDERWHHIAAVFEPANATEIRVSFYCDYRLVSSKEFRGQLRRDIINTEVVLGTGVNALIDEVRISKGALGVKDFIRVKNPGFQVIFR